MDCVVFIALIIAVLLVIVYLQAQKESFNTNFECPPGYTWSSSLFSCVPDNLNDIKFYGTGAHDISE